MNLLFKHEGKLFIGIMVLNCAVAAGMLWLVSSAITSAIKVGMGQCGQSYGIELVVSGDFFCPAVKKE